MKHTILPAKKSPPEQFKDIPVYGYFTIDEKVCIKVTINAYRELDDPPAYASHIALETASVDRVDLEEIKVRLRK